ncbi:tetratricopeptide (TPR) repeat protein/DNA-binding SARP family transcriptional activator [Catenulispora sp. MAP5-51]|uniref:AfsR/SARP family transcriptional regulator n=1 Tax=Catenulispora sp. MAP5-51 TaxID=3156298 RepID=UPI003515DC43
MDVQLLGEFQVLHDGAELDLGGPRRQAVLAVLLLNAGRTVSRQQIAQWAWPADPPDSSGNLIANYISGLRQALRPAGSDIRLVARASGFTAEFDPMSADAHRFTDLVRQARADLDGNEPAAAATRLRQALDLWHGPALGGLDTPYLDERRAELEGARRSAAMLLARIHVENQQADQAVEVLRGLLAEEPGNEPSATLLIQALIAVGDSAGAADLATRTIRASRREGREPGPALKRAQSDALGGRSVGSGTAATRLNQLPLDTRAFTGRDHELAELLEVAALSEPDGAAGTVVISAIDGMGGVGKTALALRAAHALTERFPDGQLFVDLRGVHEQTPRDPGDVLAEFLQAFGVPPGGIPAETGARAAAFRDRLAGTRTLLVLDNAGSEEQIRSLLPGTGGCLVLITSRVRLKGLDDAYPLNLDVLPIADAIALFRSIATPGRVPADDPLLEEVVALCGQLPLALRIVAALLRNRRSWTLRHLVTRLRAGRADLTAFFDGDRDLASVFDLSYESLDAAGRRTFRSLSLVPGPDADALAVAALLDTDPDTADDLLQDLVDHNLLAEVAPGRYRLQDLLRLHAGTLARSVDPAGERESAMDRLLSYYSHCAQTASETIARVPRPGPDGPAPAHAPALSDPDAARAWLRGELPNLEAAWNHAHTGRLDHHAIALATGLAETLRTEGPWPRALEVHEAAETVARSGPPGVHAGALGDLGRVRRITGGYAQAAEALEPALRIYRQLGDRFGEAVMLVELGEVRYLTGDYPGAAELQEPALEIFQALGSRLGEAAALNGLGRGRYMTGDFPGAADAQERALRIYRQAGNRFGEAAAQTNLGEVRGRIGDDAEAALALERALEIFRQIDNLHGEAINLTELGEVRARLGDYPKAAAALERALEIFRKVGSRLGQAAALNNLGRVRYLTGDYPEAAAVQERALEIYRELGSRGNEGWALNFYAATVAALGDRDRALSLYEQALVINRERKMADDEAISLEGIGEHHLAVGDPTQGIENLAAALDIYRRLGMRKDAERAQARLAEAEGGGIQASSETGRPGRSAGRVRTRR